MIVIREMDYNYLKKLVVRKLLRLGIEIIKVIRSLHGWAVTKLICVTVNLKDFIIMKLLLNLTA